MIFSIVCKLTRCRSPALGQYVTGHLVEDKKWISGHYHNRYLQYISCGIWIIDFSTKRALASSRLFNLFLTLIFSNEYKFFSVYVAWETALMPQNQNHVLELFTRWRGVSYKNESNNETFGCDKQCHCDVSKCKYLPMINCCQCFLLFLLTSNFSYYGKQRRLWYRV